MAAAGRRPDELEFVGGTRGVFPGPDAVADLDQALSAVPAQLAGGFTTICVKPSQFIDDTAASRRVLPLAGGPRRLRWASLDSGSFASVRSGQPRGGAMAKHEQQATSAARRF